MAPRVGFEPTTERLTAASSTIELPRCDLERLGLEPKTNTLKGYCSTIELPFRSINLFISADNSVKEAIEVSVGQLDSLL